MRRSPRVLRARSSGGAVGRLGAALLATVLTIGCGGEPPPQTASSWRHDSLWDDGLAEFATYEVTWSRYGEHYAGRGILVLVKEPWAPDVGVKADTPRPDGFDVLKINHLRDVPTGIYTYHQAASIFLRRDSGALVKLTSSSSEACGITTARLRGDVLETSSYFDGQGDRRTAWPAGAWPWEALPAVLRSYVVAEAPRSIEVFPSLLDSRLPELRSRTWSLTKTRPDAFEVPAGRFDAVSLELRHEDETMTWVFDRAFPHVLLQYRDEEGTEYRLAKVERLPYWNQHQPGGEAWYPASLRDGYSP